MIRDGWELWPSIVQLDYTTESAGTRLLIGGRLYEFDCEQGPNRQPHCSATHPLVKPGLLLCAAWRNHDGPHIGASREYVELAQFTITALRTADR